jgi:E3 ubiquitin-protein ligase UBR7
LFNKRNFICDCGTTRIPEATPCTLRLNPKTGQKGDVTGEEPAQSNKYNQNFRNRFCGCGEDYDPHQEKGTMFQCLGLGTVEDGGCGEDWWHPECLVGYTREEYAQMIQKPKIEDTSAGPEMTDAPAEKMGENKLAIKAETTGQTEAAQATITGRIDAAIDNGTGIDGNDVAAAEVEEDDDDTPLPAGFPAEEDFDHFICYKCLEANSWIKKYAGSEGFLPPVYLDKTLNSTQTADAATDLAQPMSTESKKRKATEDAEESTPSHLAAPIPAKRQKSEDPSGPLSSIPEDTITLPITPKKPEDTITCKHTALPPLPAPAQTNTFSLFLKPDFRDHLCRCASCFPQLKAHPQLLEEEDTYEPPMSDDGDEGAQSVGTGSILDRGEAAFNNMDRVQAIQGAMAYAHLKDKISTFLKPFAESGEAVGAEDVKKYFEKLRGDAQGIQDAAGGAKANREDDDEGGADGDGRREQSGY